MYIMGRSPNFTDLEVNKRMEDVSFINFQSSCLVKGLVLKVFNGGGAMKVMMHVSKIL